MRIIPRRPADGLARRLRSRPERFQEKGRIEPFGETCGGAVAVAISSSRLQPEGLPLDADQVLERDRQAGCDAGAGCERHSTQHRGPAPSIRILNRLGLDVRLDNARVTRYLLQFRNEGADGLAAHRGDVGCKQKRLASGCGAEASIRGAAVTILNPPDAKILRSSYAGFLGSSPHVMTSQSPRKFFDLCSADVARDLNPNIDITRDGPCFHFRPGSDCGAHGAVFREWLPI
jgi:hypothetical protein